MLKISDIFRKYQNIATPSYIIDAVMLDKLRISLKKVSQCFCQSKSRIIFFKRQIISMTYETN